MLTLTIPSAEFYDEVKEIFVNTAETTIELEHSLVSVSKWESALEKPFLAESEKTDRETIEYIKCMTLTPNVDPILYEVLSGENYKQVSDYIEAKMTATWFSDKPSTPGGPAKKEIVTAELIYYWMVALTIPFECQHWHLNRLLTLVKVTNLKNQPEKSKKMSKMELAQRNRQLNAQRKAAMGTTG